MKSLAEKSTVRVMKTLYEKGQLYASQLARELGITVRHLDRILPRLMQDSLVKCYKEGGRKYCELTEKGEALVWAILNPDALADLYKREETARVQGVRKFPRKPEALIRERIPEMSFTEIFESEIVAAVNIIKRPWIKILRCLVKMKKPNKASEIARKIKLPETKVKRYLDVMATYGYVTKEGEGWKVNLDKLPPDIRKLL